MEDAKSDGPDIKVLISIPHQKRGLYLATILVDRNDGRVMLKAEGGVETYDLGSLCVAYSREALASPRTALSAMKARRHHEAVARAAAESS